MFDTYLRKEKLVYFLFSLKVFISKGDNVCANPQEDKSEVACGVKLAYKCLNPNYTSAL